MYESYWGLTHKPFENNSNESFYYPSETHQAALLKLRYAIESRRDGAVLTGAPGLGKSLLIRTMFRMLPKTITPKVHLVFPQMPTHELLTYLAEELSPEQGSFGPLSTEAAVRRIEHALRENSEAGKHAVVVVDEAQLITDVTTLDMLRLLLNFESQHGIGLTLLFVGQPSFLPTIDRHPGVEERLAVKCLLRPLDLDESVSYVNHRLNQAGADQPIFDELALERIHAITHGNPRQINRLCDLALLIGFAEERHSITHEAIDAVSEELVAVVPE
ncbi:MAG: AAA family ATPase [Planctomycetaceae bacterium]|nr:AAA family ATPase [Planctomycetaceae bacterium]